MELYIDRICSKNLGPIIEKKIRKPVFPIIGDLQQDESKTIVLNLKIPITHVCKNIYTCERPLDDIVFLNDYDLRNVLLGKQPAGYNPLISDSRGKIYTFHKDFSIDTTFYIRIIAPSSVLPLYITYCTYYNVERKCTISSSLKYFTLLLGNPIFSLNNMTVNSLCKFKSDYVTCLYNTTIYIGICIKDNTSLLLTDSTTNIEIKDDYVSITDGHFHTVPELLKHTNYIFVCTISSDIQLYTYQNIPKTGLYYSYSVNSPVILTLENCNLFCISIYNEIHTKNKMDYIITSLQGKYNL